MARKKVSVVVLGDVARSPRMLYHAMSLAKENFDVDLVGYVKSHEDLPQSVKDFENLNVVAIPSCPDFRAYFPLLIAFAFKVFWQSITLFLTLLLRSRPEYVLVQNPPCIPTLPVCWFYSCLVQSGFVIDWHNYAFTILSLSLNPQHKLVKISKWVEQYFGRKAHINLCVTKAMKEDLSEKWGIQANVLYDRANDSFAPVPDDGSKTELRSKLSNNYKDLSALDGHVPLLISSTSWTPDEEFSILLKALEDYDESDSKFPSLFCAITGRGPERKYYLKKIGDRDWKKVKIVTPWLDAEDYPTLLGIADLGVCLHTSSSGLDLPMKVVDMFGCGLPVCALDFKCLNELVRHEENGFVFKDSKQLFQQISDWLRNFPDLSEKQRRIKEAVLTFRQTMWHENWCKVAKPLFS